MSDGVDLTFLGVQIGHLQTDMRTVKADILQIRADQARQDVELADVREELAEFRAEVRAEFVQFRAEVNARFASVDAQFDQMRQTTATNMAVVLGAIEGLSRKIDGKADPA